MSNCLYHKVSPWQFITVVAIFLAITDLWLGHLQNNLFTLHIFFPVWMFSDNKHQIILDSSECNQWYESHSLENMLQDNLRRKFIVIVIHNFTSQKKSCVFMLKQTQIRHMIPYFKADGACYKPYTVKIPKDNSSLTDEFAIFPPWYCTCNVTAGTFLPQSPSCPYFFPSTFPSTTELLNPSILPFQLTNLFL